MLAPACARLQVPRIGIVEDQRQDIDAHVRTTSARASAMRARSRGARASYASIRLTLGQKRGKDGVRGCALSVKLHIEQDAHRLRGGDRGFIQHHQASGRLVLQFRERSSSADGTRSSPARRMPDPRHERRPAPHRRVRTHVGFDQHARRRRDRCTEGGSRVLPCRVGRRRDGRSMRGQFRRCHPGKRAACRFNASVDWLDRDGRAASRRRGSWTSVVRKMVSIPGRPRSTRRSAGSAGPSPSIRPSDVPGGWTPRPRNEREVSRRMVPGKFSVACTTSAADDVRQEMA